MIKPLHFALFAFMLLAGTAMRFHTLDRQSLWDDETYTLRDLAAPATAWGGRFGVHEMHPPLYFLTLRAWRRMAGPSLGDLRAWSAFWGSLSLIFFFFLARRYLDDDMALAAMALLTFSPYHLAYSQELRPYGLAIALSILSYGVLESCLTKPQDLKRWMLLGSLWTALLYTHYWGSFVVASGIVYGWIQAAKGGPRKQLMVTALAACGLFAIWLPILASQLRVVGPMGFWMPPASISNLFKTGVAFTGLFFHHASLAFRAPGPLAWHLLVGALTLGLAAIGLRKGPRAAILWLFVGIGLPEILSYWMNGLYLWYRYPSLLYPAFLLLIVSGLSALPKRWMRWSVLGILLFQSSWSCYTYMTQWQKANPKSVMAYVQDLKQPHTVIIRPTYFAYLFEFYDHGPTSIIDQDSLDSDEKREVLQGKNIVFLAFDVPFDPVRDAILARYKVQSSRYFPGYARLGVTVYQLK